MNLHFVTTKRFLQQRKKTQAILLVGENALPPITSGANMIKGTFILNSQLARHCQAFSQNHQLVSIVRTDPFS